MARERFAAKPKAALEISRAFGAVADSIKRDLLSLTPESYSQMKAMETKRRIDKRLAALASYSARWAQRAVASSYAESSGVAITRLQMLGFKRSRRYNSDQHAQAKNRVRGKMTETFIKAIHSMRDMTARYVAALGQADVQLQQIQEFNPGFIPGEVIADIVAKTLAARKARVYAQRLLMDYLRGLVGTEKYIQVGERMFKVRDYAEMVARTELHEAYTEAVKEQAKEYGCDLLQMSSHDSPCEICAPLEGQIFSISGDHPTYPPLTDDVETPIHPNCLLPGTKAESPGGFIAGLRARYSGPAVEVIFSEGTQVSVSINHMFLTPFGFAPAYLLREGDDVFSCVASIRSVPINPNDHNSPTIVEKIFGSLLKSSGVTAGTVPSSSEYLHGDGRFVNGDIDIVGAYRFLGCADKSGPAQRMQTKKFDGTNTELASFAREGDLFAVFKCLAFTADSIMGGSRAPNPFFLARTSGGDPMTFANTANENISFYKPNMDSLIRDFESLRQIAFEKSGLIKTTKVIYVRRFEYTGHIYDLQSLSTLYIANGMLSSNCEHNLNPISEAALEWGS